MNSFYISENPNKDQFRKKTTHELQMACNELNLDSHGKKSELVDRLFDFFAKVGDKHAVIATTCVKFNVEPNINLLTVRSKLERVAPLVAFLYLPKSNECYATYTTSDNAKKLYSLCKEYNFDNPQYVEDKSIDRLAVENEIIDDNLVIDKLISDIFYITKAEPKIYYCPAFE